MQQLCTLITLQCTREGVSFASALNEEIIRSELTDLLLDFIVYSNNIKRIHPHCTKGVQGGQSAVLPDLLKILVLTS